MHSSHPNRHDGAIAVDAPRPKITEHVAALPRVDLGLAVLRVVVGAVFAVHGCQKLFTFGIGGVSDVMAQLGIPLPYLSAVLATAAEFGGGIALIVGFGTRFAALNLAFVMLVAFITAHAGAGFFLPHGYEYVLTLGAVNIALAISGPGRVSFDARRAARRG